MRVGKEDCKWRDREGGGREMGSKESFCQQTDLLTFTFTADHKLKTRERMDYKKAERGRGRKYDI